MFKSFFPRPGPFFLSAVIWGIVAVMGWFLLFENLPLHIAALSKIAQHRVSNNVLQFIQFRFLWFYLYYWLAAAIFALTWHYIDNHPWQKWSVWGSLLIIFSTWFSVQISVAINAWYGPFGDLIQKSLSKANTIKIETFYLQILAFMSIAMVAIVIGIINSFFVSHWIFRWRTAMNNYYTANWQQLRHIEGAAQRVQEDTMNFATTLEDWGINFIKAVMTLIAFVPVLAALSSHVKVIPLIGNIPYALVFVALFWSILGTVIMAVVGIKLPGLSFKNQQVEAAFRKELVYGEDDEQRAQPVTLQALFSSVRFNYFRLYFHYLYFNFARILYMQADTVFGVLILLPTIVMAGITLGIMNQTLNVLDQVRGAFQYLINTWSTLVNLMSIYKRLNSFEQTLNSRTQQQTLQNSTE